MGVVAAVICADQFSAGLIKEWAQRLRPCNEPSLSALIRPIVPCGSGYSFISSHATNHFALAVFFSWFFKSISNWKPYHWIFYFWAFSICFAQVYVGVHYPFDVILGAIAGLLIGRILLYLTKYYLNKSSN